MTQLICLKRLWILFLQPQQYSYPSVFIYGHRASGKSHVMQVLLKELEVWERFAVIAESLEAKWCLTDLKQMLSFLKESFVLGNIAFYLKFAALYTKLFVCTWNVWVDFCLHSWFNLHNMFEYELEKKLAYLFIIL